MRPHIFFDLDGVLANFDKAAGAILGTDNIYKYEFVHGPEDFWSKLHATGDFFLSMEKMPDADELLMATCNNTWTILTALPRTDPQKTDAQKRQWVQENIAHDVPVITCATKDKPQFCVPGAILIDDRALNRKAWEKAGGQYVLHTSAADSIRQLRDLGAL